MRTVGLHARRKFAKPFDGPVRLDVKFVFTRPKSDYRSGKNSHLLKDSAPPAMTKKPDLTKLVRCLEDGLSGIAFEDDSQVVRQQTSKDFGSKNCAIVTVSSVSGQPRS